MVDAWLACGKRVGNVGGALHGVRGPAGGAGRISLSGGFRLILAQN